MRSSFHKRALTTRKKSMSSHKHKSAQKKNEDSVHFWISGHPLIRAEHKTTLEFTKDDYVTNQGDCIVGIKATFLRDSFQHLQGKIGVKIGKEVIVGYKNPLFSDSHEIVLRKSTFASSRTLLIKANKAALDLSSRLKQQLQNPQARKKVEVFPIALKAIFFDFDNTLEDWTSTDEPVHKWLYDTLHQMTGLEKAKVVFFWQKAKEEAKKNPTDQRYERFHWFAHFFAAVGMNVDTHTLRKLTDTYWELRKKHAQLFPGVKQTLQYLRRKGYALALISDSDGLLRYKKERIAKFGIEKYFQAIVLGNSVHKAKPASDFFLKASNQLNIQPYEAMMIGDDPRRDLLSAKELGLTTVWIKKGHWSETYQQTPRYVDYVIHDIPEVLSIAENLKQKRS